MASIDFSGKHVIVTGGASGVGAALLDLPAELGLPQVTVLDLRRPTGPHEWFLETDLADNASLQAAIAQIRGPVNVLFNNAGVADTLPRDT